MFTVRYIRLFLLLSCCFGQVLLNESFDDSDNLPAGWEFIPAIYPTNTGQWQISSWANDFNANAPSATYHWSPSVPNSFEYPYEEHYLYSPIIYVDSPTNATMRFQIAFDGYPSPAGHYNGINFEYSSDGDEWVTALNYEISAGGETVDIYPRVESFYASMDSNLQLRWETYGTNSYYIDAWHIDDISVIVASCLADIEDQYVQEDEILEIVIETDSCNTDSISFISNSNDTNITTYITNDSLIIVPAPDWYGVGEINLFVISNDDTVDSEHFLVNVISVNDEGPIIDSIPDYTIDEDTSLEIILNASDYDDDEIYFTATSSDSSVSASLQDTLLIVAPQNDWNGASEINIIASDDSLSDTVSFHIFINPVNDSPEPFSLIYPTVTDTISIHTDTDETLQFNWEESIDIDSQVSYITIVTLGYFGETYTDTYESSEPMVEVSPYEWAVLMTNLELERWTLEYTVQASDEEYTVETGGEFVFQNNTLSVENDITPLSFRLHQNYPNPFNPVTTVRYELPEDSYTDITVYDMLGNMVNNLVSINQSSGYKSIQWNATNNQGEPVSAGVYLYKIQAGNFVDTKKMILLK